jgi:hypothetical protein
MSRDSRLKTYRSKGKLYVYHRATGERIRSEPNGEAYWQEVALLDQKAAAMGAEKDRTLGDLCRAYLQSPEFASVLAASTRREYLRTLRRVESLYAHPASTIDRAFVLELRKQVFFKKNARIANEVLRVLSRIFIWAVPLGYVAANPFKGVVRPKPKKGVKQPAPTNREVVIHPRQPTTKRRPRSRLSVDHEKMLSLLDEKEE